MTKRHAKPTSAQLLDRIYRKILALQAYSDVQHVRTELHLDSMERKLDSLAPLVDHCARLLKEKETLAKQLETAMANQCKCPPSITTRNSTYDEIIAARLDSAPPADPRKGWDIL